MLRVQPLVVRGLRCHSARLRCHSTRSAPAFASYFFNNDQWTSAPLTAGFPPASALHPAPASAFKPAPPLNASRLVTIYAQLAKRQLTVLNVLATMAAVALCPLPIAESNAHALLSFADTLPPYAASVATLLATATGTALASASANALNQLVEVPFDAQMARTRNRPLVRRAISPLHAFLFAAITGTAGTLTLLLFVNPTTAALAAANIALYAGPYTILKRRTIWNTWVGAVVGAIPPLMGWTACGGALWPTAGKPVSVFLPEWATGVWPMIQEAPVHVASWLQVGTLSTLGPEALDNPLAWVGLFAFLFCWQFPHFNAFSYTVRASYAQAGYRMLAVLDPRRNARVGIRYLALLTASTTLLVPASGLTSWWLALTALPPAVVWGRSAIAWWGRGLGTGAAKNKAGEKVVGRLAGGGEKAARDTFWHSLWYMPVVLALMMVHKTKVPDEEVKDGEKADEEAKEMSSHGETKE
ncbi:UbiA prenyltransferase family-domain-containing protein [Schizophyllum amplum]|uniref:Protoheme IX farnesyltransferase, mitochondrial n=1 Tax=Schizophyllum amplum TaxID=97359 RepID=A0A550CSK8_9AGAR|nr:UbiA prenyltransferase family-domain-containing protein [Auriculariopsis ampla]